MVKRVPLLLAWQSTFVLLWFGLGCGEVGAITYNLSSTTSGEFSSPNYPEPYPADQNIEWRIPPHPGKVHRLVIDDYFTEECCDKVRVMIGGTFVSTLAGTMNVLCHDYVAPEGQDIVVMFSSDNSVSQRGFHAIYYTGNVNQLNGTSGEIRSRGFLRHLPYPDWYFEAWVISFSNWHMKVSLEFHTLETELGKDYLTILDGSNPCGPVLANISGNSIPPPLISPSNHLYIFMKADGRNSNFTGFHLSYHALVAEFRPLTLKQISTATTTTLPPLCAEPGFYRIPHQTDCEKFIECVNQVDTTLDCGPGLWFDETLQECNLLEEVDCQKGNGTGKGLCPSEGVTYIRVPGNCQAYIMCAHGEPITRQCPNKTAFNESTTRCERDEDGVLCIGNEDTITTNLYDENVGEDNDNSTFSIFAVGLIIGIVVGGVLVGGVALWVWRGLEKTFRDGVECRLQEGGEGEDKPITFNHLRMEDDLSWAN